MSRVFCAPVPTAVSSAPDIPIPSQPHEATVLWSFRAATKPLVLSVGSTQKTTPPSLKSPTLAGSKAAILAVKAVIKAACSSTIVSRLAIAVVCSAVMPVLAVLAIIAASCCAVIPLLPPPLSDPLPVLSVKTFLALMM